VSSCSAVCPLCWLPRRLVYVRHVRILDSKKKLTNSATQQAQHQHQHQHAVRTSEIVHDSDGRIQAEPLQQLCTMFGNVAQ
jgi:hypothetical protein